MTRFKKNRKIHLGLFFGGRSFEHEVSIVTAKSIEAALDRNTYEVKLVYLDREGRWIVLDQIDRLEGLHVSVEEALLGLDVAFPAFHGPIGEDGAMQGLFKVFNLPFVGPDVLSSSICYDKVATKFALSANGLPIIPYRWFEHDAALPYEVVAGELGHSLFVKPANTGSSVGISKVRNQAEYEAALTKAAEIDTKIVVEQTIEGREIEVAVLGNDELLISQPGEIVPSGDFYTYEAKYVEEDEAALIVPTQLDISLDNLAERAYRACFCSGMTRIDFRISTEGEVYINELNTIPGFTPISLYPKLMANEGIEYSELIDRLVALAFDDHEVKNPVHIITK